jgi:hypothetical protein
MIKIFQLLIHQVLDSVELNEKTFSDRGSGFIVEWECLCECKNIRM